jgi:hypothetical protein
MEFELACLATIEFVILIYVSISLGMIKAQLKIIEENTSREEN